jgi:hypothetical protein
MGLATGDPERHRPARLDCDLGRLPLVGGAVDLLAALGLAVALAGFELLALLERLTSHSTIWTAVAVQVALLSLVGPLSSIPDHSQQRPVARSCTLPSPSCSSPCWQGPASLPTGARDVKVARPTIARAHHDGAGNRRLRLRPHGAQ